MAYYTEDVDQVSSASMQGAEMALASAQLGAQQYASVVSGGMQRMVGDLGRMMPAAPSAQMHPFTQVRHGMYGHEMSLTGSIAGSFGYGIPETTTAYEFQAMAREDFSRRVANTAVFGGLNTAGAAAGWVGGGALLSKGARTGWQMGKSAAFGRMGGAAAVRAGTLGVGAARAGMVAGGLAGGLIGALPGVAAFMAVDATVGQIIEDVQDRQDIMNHLEASSFRYIQGQGPDVDPKFGAGFSRQARGRIAEDIRKIDLADPSYNMGDLKGILERGTEMGMFEGTRSAEEFSQKFKDLTSNLKTVTRVLHQSLAEGMETLKDLKEQGYRGPGAAMGAVMQADVLGTATGRTAAEMLSIGRQGAEMVRGTGINLATGSAMMQQTYGLVQGAVNAGTLDREMVAQAGGVGALSQQVVAQSLGMLNSDVGRGFMFGVMQRGGGLDANRYEQFMSGNMDMGQVLDAGTSNLRTGADYINAVVSRGQTTRDVAKQFGGMGAVLTSTRMEMVTARQIASDMGLEGPDAVRKAFIFQAMQRGEAEESITGRLSMFDNYEDTRTTRMAALRVSTEKLQGEEIRDRLSIGGRISDALGRAIEPVSTDVGRMVDRVASGIQSTWTDVTTRTRDWLVGAERVGPREISERDLYNLVVSGEINKKISPEESAKHERLNKSIWTSSERERFAAGDEKKISTIQSRLKDIEEIEKRPAGERTPQDNELLSKKQSLQEDLENENRFKTLDGEYGDKFFTADVARNSGDIETLSKAVFGKRWDDLEKHERMYLDVKVRDVGGMDRVKEQIGVKQREAATEKRDLGADSVIKSSADVKKHEQEVKSLRTDIIKKASEGQLEDMGLRGVKNITKNVMEKLSDDPRGVKDLDTLITTSSTIKRLEDKKTSGEPLTEEETLELDNAKKERQVAQKSITSNKTLGISLEDMVKVSDRLLDVADELPGVSEFVSAKEGLVEAQGGEARIRLQTKREERFSALLVDTAGKVSSGEAKKLEGILGRVREGVGLGSGDIKDLISIGKESGVGGIAAIARQAQTLEGIQEISGNENDLRKNLSTFLESEQISFGKNKEEKDAFLDKFIKDGKLETGQLLENITLFDARDAAQGTTVKGGGDVKSIEAVASASMALQQVQNETVAVLKQLQVMHSELLSVTKTKGGG